MLSLRGPTLKKYTPWNLKPACYQWAAETSLVFCWSGIKVILYQTPKSLVIRYFWWSVFWSPLYIFLFNFVLVAVSTPNLTWRMTVWASPSPSRTTTTTTTTTTTQRTFNKVKKIVLLNRTNYSFKQSSFKANWNLNLNIFVFSPNAHNL